MTELPKKRPGRPRKYPEGQASKHGGAPQLQVRLEPELLAWIQANGGASWVRQLLEAVDAPLWDWVQSQGGGAWVRQVVATAREKGQLDAADLAPFPVL